RSCYEPRGCLGGALECSGHLLVVEAAEIAEQEGCSAVEPKHCEGSLDGVDSTGAEVVDFDTDGPGASPKHPADALGPGRESLTVPAGARDRPIEGGPAIDAQARRWVATCVVDATGDERHGVRLVIDQVRGIRD